MSDSSASPAPVLTLADVKIIEPQMGGSKIIVVCRVPMTDSQRQSQNAIRVLNSIELKNFVYDNRAKLGLSDFGIQKFGSHRPYTDGGQYEHGGKVDGYEQEFRFTRNG